MENSKKNEINSIKESFHTIYTSNDPRPYYHGMSQLEYQIPQNAKPYLEYLIYEARQKNNAGHVNILDVGCSYGVLSSLIKFNLDLDLLYNLSATDAPLIDYRTLPTRDYISFYGIDVSKPAVDYANACGLHQGGLACDLESSSSITHGLLPERCDLIVSTGCYGYITERTIDALVSHYSRPPLPIIAFLVMRPFDYCPAIQLLKSKGYSTRKFESHSFRQRRFSSCSEKEEIVKLIKDRGICSVDDEPPETDGFSYADLYISTQLGGAGTKIFDVLDRGQLESTN